jgi:predicted glutamine amidotransferase
MCIMMTKKQGVKLDKTIYENCFANNADGAGFAFVRNKEIYIAKGFFTFNDFWDNFKPFEEEARIIHFRVGTSGGSNALNCHPWRINDDLAIAHNGSITINRDNQALSDTGNYCESILQPLTKDFPEWWKSKEMLWMMEKAIGPNNKIILLHKEGDIQILNEKSGIWRGDCWFSNATFTCAKKYETNWEYESEYSSQNRANNQVENEFDKLNSELYTSIDVDSIDAALEKVEDEQPN